MWSSVILITHLVACVEHSMGRVLSASRNNHRHLFSSSQYPPRPIQPAITFNKLERSRYPQVPDYVFKSILDYPPESQAKLLQDHQDSEVIPGLYEGDMAGMGPEFLAHTRVGLKWDVFPERRWDNATVPYVISSLYLPSEHQIIETAIATLNFMTCVKFVPWDRKAEDYLLIWPMKSPSGCWSYVGKRGGQQIVSLQAPDERSKRCLGTVGKPIHEFLHALGIFHEQARSDRDNYVTIVKDNIILDYIHNFDKQSELNTTFSFDYDYNSVMHYGSNFFSFSRNKPTIVPKVKGVTIGQRIMLSKTDCLKVNQLYGCLDEGSEGGSFQRDKYLAICTHLGL